MVGEPGVQTSTLTLTRPRRLSPVALRRLTGAAGLGYVVLAGVENMGILGAPLSGAPVPEIRAAYEDGAVQVVTTAAGALSLLLYAMFAVAMAARPAIGERWRAVALAAGVGGPLLAAVGVAAHVALIGGASDGATRDLFELEQGARMVAGGLMATFLLALGIGGGLPRALSRLAVAAAVPLTLGPVAAVADVHALDVAVVIAFGGHALWIWAASLWLAVGGHDLVRRAAFLMLVVAAGAVGLALLIVPDATGSFFAWSLKPSPLAAFAGGVYVGSAAVYAAGLRAPARSLVVAAAVLSVSVLAITIIHLDVFDLDRLQAWAWLVLFAGFAAATSGLAVTGRGDRGGVAGGGDGRGGGALAGWARGLFAALAAALGALGLALWIDPAAVAAAGPFELPPLGGRFAGSWIVMLAVLAGWAAAAGRREEARLPALALVALPAGALVAAARTYGDMAPTARPGYVAALALLLAAGVALRRASGDR